MPKGKRKGKYDHKRTEQFESSDEDAGIDMTVDNLSEASGQSDLRSVQEDTESDIQEKFEEKVLELLDALNARANAARAAAMVSLRSALQRRAASTLLASHRATLADHLARTLRRGRDAERRAAAALAPLLALQIGDEGAEEFVTEVRRALTATIVDKSVSIETRAECCSSLAVLCYIFEEDIVEILEVMRVYETIFSGSYLKGDGSVKVSGAAIEEGLYHANALDGWALLLTLLSTDHARSVLEDRAPSYMRLSELLHAASLEVRMAAGGALAIVHETVTEEGASEESPCEPLVQAVMPRLDELARGSQKNHAKKDRKAQRATFRDILKYLEEDEIPSLTVRVGTENVICSSWGSRAAYGMLAASLGAGLQTLAPTSPPLRAALHLPEDAPLLAHPRAKLDKLQRHLQNIANDKARTVARNRNRDKRSAALTL